MHRNFLVFVAVFGQVWVHSSASPLTLLATASSEAASHREEPHLFNRGEANSHEAIVHPQMQKRQLSLTEETVSNLQASSKDVETPAMSQKIDEMKTAIKKGDQKAAQKALKAWSREADKAEAAQTKQKDSSNQAPPNTDRKKPAPPTVGGLTEETVSKLQSDSKAIETTAMSQKIDEMKTAIQKGDQKEAIKALKAWNREADKAEAASKGSKDAGKEAPPAAAGSKKSASPTPNGLTAETIRKLQADSKDIETPIMAQKADEMRSAIEKGDKKAARKALKAWNQEADKAEAAAKKPKS